MKVYAAVLMERVHVAQDLKGNYAMKHVVLEHMVQTARIPVIVKMEQTVTL